MKFFIQNATEARGGNGIKLGKKVRDEREVRPSKMSKNSTDERQWRDYYKKKEQTWKMHTVKEMIISRWLSFSMGSNGKVYKLCGKRHGQTNDVNQSSAHNTPNKAPLGKFIGIVFISNFIFIIAFLI